MIEESLEGRLTEVERLLEQEKSEPDWLFSDKSELRERIKKRVESKSREDTEYKGRLKTPVVDKLSQSLSDRIDRLRANTDRVVFSIKNRRHLEQLRELAEIEDVNLNAICKQIVIDFVEDLSS